MGWGLFGSKLEACRGLKVNLDDSGDKSFDTGMIYRLLALGICLTLCCCPKPPNPISMMLTAAELIVKEPQKWQGNTVLVVDYQKAAQKANLSDDDVVTRFEAAAIKLVTFGTEWTNVASKEEQAEYRKLTVEAMGKPSPTGTATYEIGDSSQKILDLISRSLERKESERFEETWTNALQAFKALNVRYRKMAEG